MSQGDTFIISAPSGAGKTSLVAALLQNDPGLGVAVSHTTRAARSGEINGKHYHFTEPEQFRAMVDNGEFLEHAEVFGNHYGTSRHAAQSVHAQGRDLILEIDWQGARIVQQAMPEAHWILIAPPSLDSLAQRLRARGTDSEDVIARRLNEARHELVAAAEHADYLVINDDFATALTCLHCIVRSARLTLARQAPQGVAHKLCLN